MAALDLAAVAGTHGGFPADLMILRLAVRDTGLAVPGAGLGVLCAAVAVPDTGLAVPRPGPVVPARHLSEVCFHPTGARALALLRAPHLRPEPLPRLIQGCSRLVERTIPAHSGCRRRSRIR
ncbi:hypothetical protein [Catellatospora coxensis]|uniref:hypothetical protein n=1 Tax=Catellatospora coxensis TaxID=310354 RepID=UPI0019403C50|nr:hypothetical protein [Catellatospora coxensis]